MQIILKKNFKSLGEIGDILNVKNGYARNFLIPRDIAMEANNKNKKILENKKIMFLQQSKKDQKKIELLEKKISNIDFIQIKRKIGSQNKIFGSVNVRDVLAILKKNFDIILEKKNIIFTEPIKSLGNFIINIKSFSGKLIELNLNIIEDKE